MVHARVTVTLPTEIVEDIDRRERNRSRFVLDAIRRELKRRRREDLKRSLESPHPETSELADAGLDDWAARLPSEKASDLLDVRAGRAVRWVPGRGWTSAASTESSASSVPKSSTRSIWVSPSSSA